MAKYTGPKCKRCRREGTKLFLKGSRCSTEKCSFTKRGFPPGQHGLGRKRYSDYSKHLREKQKVKRIYGVLEAQFRRYYYKAEKIQGITGETLLQMLERRLDNVVYTSGLAPSRDRSRQVIRQGKITVNGKKVTIPSYQLNAKDIVASTEVETRPKEDDEMVAWLAWDGKENNIKVVALPARDDISQEINEQLIVEFYSR